VENKIKGKMSEVQFLKWRLAIEQMQHASTKAQLQEKTYSVMGKDMEISRMKVALYRPTVNSAVENAKLAEIAYHKVREELEVELGFTLKDTIVNEITMARPVYNSFD